MYWSKSCSLATPSIPMMFLFPLLTTTRLGFVGSVMKKHWSTLVASTHGSFFRGHVCTGGLGFGCFGYNHGCEIPVFSFDVLCPSDTEHRHLFSTVVELPDLLDSSVESFLHVVIGVEFRRYA